MRGKYEKLQEKMDTADLWLAQRPWMDCLFAVTRVAIAVGILWAVASII